MTGTEHQPHGVSVLWTHQEQEDRWVRQNLPGMGEPSAPDIQISLPEEHTWQATLQLYTFKVQVGFEATSLMGTMSPLLNKMINSIAEPPNDQNRNHNVRRSESDSKQNEDAAGKQVEMQVAEKAEKHAEKKGAKKKEPFLARFQYNVSDHSVRSCTTILYGRGYYAFEQPKFWVYHDNGEFAQCPPMEAAHQLPGVNVKALVRMTVPYPNRLRVASGFMREGGCVHSVFAEELQYEDDAPEHALTAQQVLEQTVKTIMDHWGEAETMHVIAQNGDHYNVPWCVMTTPAVLSRRQRAQRHHLDDDLESDPDLDDEDDDDEDDDLKQNTDNMPPRKKQKLSKE